jgi:2-polyprenyl-3-methyl-5-hydroxy-6-metoxy-1,4-benzoquinol methylase
MKKSAKYISKDTLVHVQPCNLCNSSDFNIEFAADRFHFVKCRNCGLLYRSQIPSQEHLNEFYKIDYYKKFISYVNSQLNSPPQEYYLFAEKLLKLVKPNCKGEKPKSLDIGCGAGCVVAAFSEVGWEALGIDLNIKSVIEGKKLGRNLYCGSINRQGLGTYDAITAFHVLEHVSDPKHFLAECRNRLAEKGLLLVEVPNVGSRRANRMRERWPYLYPNLHFYQFTEKTFKKYFVDMHFKIIDIKKINGRGPLEVCNGQDRKQYRVLTNFKSILFISRKLILWVPGLRELIRNIIWQKMGYGEFLQLLACKK